MQTTLSNIRDSMSSNEDAQTVPSVSINIHTSTTFHGFKRCEPAKRCKRKPKFQGCANKIHILKILTKNDKRRVHVYPSRSIKSKNKRRKSKDKKLPRPKPSVSIPILQMDEEGEFESDCEEDREERRKSIEEKISKGEYMFTKLEEKDIHIRAEEYCRSVTADIYHYVRPGDPESHLKDPAFLANMDCFRLKYLPSYKRKRQSYETENCYIKSHDHLDPYDNTKFLPIGTKLLKPSGKLVELVAKVLQESPNGLLQAPQIYAALQNKYPYFRYMEKSAISSWRSSVRHALYQKWFKKVEFFVSHIQCRGSYWAFNTEPDPPKKKPAKIKKLSTQATKETDGANDKLDPNSTKKRRSRKKKNVCHLQFKSNGELVEMKETKEKVRKSNVTSSLQELLNIAKQYGLAISLTTPPVPVKTEVENGSILPQDPVLSSWPVVHLNEANKPTSPVCDWNVMHSTYISGKVKTQGSERNLVSSPLLPNIRACFRSVDSSSKKEKLPDSTFNRNSSFNLEHAHSLEKKTKSYSHEMLGNVRTIFNDSEITYIDKDSVDLYSWEDFLSSDPEETTENSESEEPLNDTNSVCHSPDEFDNDCMLCEEDSNNSVGVKTWSNFYNVHSTSEPENLNFYSVPSPISDDSNGLTVGDFEFLNSILQTGGNQAEEQDDFLMDTNLINEDSFFQQCEFFDSMDK